ncbi:Palmitoyltransferase zdhhc2 [Basidiobolus ranarum]|uniref:Palmitoyltransferase n=1 Tax=Basidiobolus ranarum TaxID=34480 RepID=A0ABR2WQ10_9FUNG
MLGWSYYTYVFSLVAELISYNFEQAIAQLSIFSILFALVVVSYLRALLTHAGSPIQFNVMHDSKGHVSQRELLAAESQESLPSLNSDTWCDTYNNSSVRKPDMAMVLPGAGQYDTMKSTKWVLEGSGPDQIQHLFSPANLVESSHCPWINRCVGWRNYKIFILLIFYTSLYCIYIPASVIYPVVTRYREGLGIHIEWTILISLTTFVGIFLVALTVFHAKLIMRNQTTIESIRQKQKHVETKVNVYDLGPIENWKAIMGSNLWFWFVPTVNSSGDGYEFPQTIDTETYVKTMQERRFSTKTTNSTEPSFTTTKSSHRTTIDSSDNVSTITSQSGNSTTSTTSLPHEVISITLPPIPKFTPLHV